MAQTETFLDALGAELRAVNEITSRDLVKRLVSGLLILWICYFATDKILVLWLAGFLLLTELVSRVCADIFPDRNEEISPALVCVIWLNNAASTFAYLAPGTLLAMQPSVPLLLGGFIWTFGVFVHITNTFTAMPYYNWSQMVPGFLAAALTMHTASQTGYATRAEWEWFAASGIFLVYASNTLQTLIMQRTTQKALAAARKEANARLNAMEKVSKRDSLTRLLNRSAFDERLTAMIGTRRPESEVAVFLIDLDRFKPINDSYSHNAGDQVLITMGQRLIEASGEHGVAARFGGDEFGLAVPYMRGKTETLNMGIDLLSSLERPIDYEGRTLRVGASIGVSITSLANRQVSSICAAADQAMYRAKSETSEKVILYEKENFAQRITLHDKTRIVDALTAGEIGPHYQPKVDLRTGRLAGFEALARWEHPTNGLQLPGQFLPHVDELGLQGDFLNHMAKTVMRDVTDLLNEGLDPGQVSINVPEVTLATFSGRQDLDRILAQFPKAISHITFEITEDVFITRAGDYIQESISHFRAQGVRVSLDDFGTGFASFQHLRELEFDELKIDTSFVAGLGWDHSAEVLVDGFLTIAKGLGVDVIAEGVETDAQRARLLELGAVYGQGWRFGRAVPLDEARVRMLAEQTGQTPAPPVRAIG